jgi:hypothetical protein
VFAITTSVATNTPRSCSIQLRKTGPNNDNGRGKFVREVSVMSIGVYAPARYMAKLSFLALLWDLREGAGGIFRDETARFSFLMESILHQMA